MKHIKGLDTLRAFAVIVVLIDHWGPHTFKSGWVTSIYSKLRPEGLFGVDLFFVLSGFLITRILLNARNGASPGARLHIIKSFYIRRILRIFPIYFLVVLTVAYAFNDQYVKDHILYYITYTSNFLTFKEKAWLDLSHTWSLSIEEQFYLIWPWAIIYSPKKYLLSVILFSISLGIVSSIVLNNLYGSYFYVLLLPCITAFAIGALFAYVEVFQRFKKVVVKAFLILLPFSVILMAIHQFGDKLYLIRVAYAVISINAIIYVCRQKYNRVTGYMLNNKLLTGIGKISYGIYLYHYILPRYYYAFLNYLETRIKFNDKLLRILTNPPPAYVIQLVLLCIIAILSYNYFEVPFLKLKKHFRYTYNPQAVAKIVNS